MIAYVLLTTIHSVSNTYLKKSYLMFNFFSSIKKEIRLLKVRVLLFIQIMILRRFSIDAVTSPHLAFSVLECSQTVSVIDENNFQILHTLNTRITSSVACILTAAIYFKLLGTVYIIFWIVLLTHKMVCGYTYLYMEISKMKTDYSTRIYTN